MFPTIGGNDDGKKTEPNEGGGATSPASAATSGAAEVVAKRRGRPKGSTNAASAGAGNTGGANTSVTAAQQAQMQAQFDQLYNPVVWRGIVAAPGNVALAVTGSQVWDIPEDEINTLAIQASVTARCFAVSDPKWLALTMLSISIISTYGMRAAQYFIEKAEKQRELENKNPPK